MQGILQSVLQFLKKHYEKLILCAVLLGLAAAAIWMGKIISEVTAQVGATPEMAASGKPLKPLDLTSDMMVLATVTNPPSLTLSGAHNLFNPVTWRQKRNGDLLKILKTGPDALRIVNITPLYTVVDYDHPSGSGAVYVLNIQIHSVKKAAEYAKKDEVKKGRPYIIRGIKGAEDNPDQLELEIPESGQLVWISKGNPYKAVDGHTVDMVYDPESLTLNRKKVDDTITLDNEPYKIVEITNDLVRVQSISNTKVTTIAWNRRP
jgi:hypothetical protein